MWHHKLRSFDVDSQSFRDSVKMMSSRRLKSFFPATILSLNLLQTLFDVESRWDVDRKALQRGKFNLNAFRSLFFRAINHNSEDRHKRGKVDDLFDFSAGF